MSGTIKLSDDDSGKRLALIFCLLVLTIYAFFPTKTFYWDGIIYAKFIEDSPNFGSHLFHPNHLVYNFLGWTAHRTWQIFGPTRALFVLQSVTIVFGALSAFVFFLIGKRVFRSTHLSASMTAIFAFSAAWWKFSTDADVYVISVFFLLAGFLLIIPGQKPRPFSVAAAHTLAMFFHQLAVLFFPVVLLGLVFQTAKLDWRERFMAVLRYGLTAFLLTFGTYCLGFYMQTGSLDLKYFGKWMTSYAASAGFSFNFSESLRQTFRGHQKLFFDGSSNLFEPSFLNYVVLAIFVAAAVALLVKAARNSNEIKLFFKTVIGRKTFIQPVVWLCIAWTIPYLFFLFFFLPENLFYRLFYFPALVLLLGALLSPFENAKRVRRSRLALFALLFCLYNFLFYIEPNSRIRENTQIWLALKANSVWSEKSIVFYDPSITDEPHEANNRLVRYFNPAVQWRSTASLSPNDFESEVSKIRSAGGDVWLEGLVFKQMSGDERTAAWLAENSESNSELDVPKYDMRFVKIVPRSSEKENR